LGWPSGWNRSSGESPRAWSSNHAAWSTSGTRSFCAVTRAPALAIWNASFMRVA
jgi:hypothetical protein